MPSSFSSWSSATRTTESSSTTRRRPRSPGDPVHSGARLRPQLAARSPARARRRIHAGDGKKLADRMDFAIFAKSGDGRSLHAWDLAFARRGKTVRPKMVELVPAVPTARSSPARYAIRLSCPADGQDRPPQADGDNWRTIGAIVTRMVKKHLDPKRLEDLYVIGIDENLFRRNHDRARREIQEPRRREGTVVRVPRSVFYNQKRLHSTRATGLRPPTTGQLSKRH